MSRRQFDPSLEHRDVGSQRRVVGSDPLWNIAMLAFNVATLVFHLSGTSQRWFCISLERRDVGFQRRDVGFNHSLERRNVGSQRRDVGCFPL